MKSFIFFSSIGTIEGGLEGRDMNYNTYADANSYSQPLSPQIYSQVPATIKALFFED